MPSEFFSFFGRAKKAGFLMRESDILVRFRSGIKPKPNKKSAKKQVQEAKKALLDKVRSELVNKKRGLPAEWQKGIVIAIDIVDRNYD